MSYSDEKLNKYYDKAGGRCTHCGKTIRWKHYGDRSKGKGWEVDHLIPKSRGGSNRDGNLAASCWGCNASKGASRW